MEFFPNWFFDTLERGRIVARVLHTVNTSVRIEVFSISPSAKHGILGGHLSYLYSENGDYRPVIVKMFTDGSYAHPAVLRDRACRYAEWWPSSWQVNSEIVCQERAPKRKLALIPASSSIVLQNFARMEGMARTQGRLDHAKNKPTRDFVWQTAVRLSGLVREQNRQRAAVISAQN